MRKVFLFFVFYLFLLMPAMSDVTYPNHYDDHVNDFAKVLTKTDSDAIRNKLTDVQKQTGIQIVVVTVNSLSDFGASSVPFQKYAANLFDHWGIGDKNKNNGVLIFFSLGDREARIEMGLGYAHALDGKIQRIVDETMIPSFKNEEYSRGLYDGANSVVSVVTKEVSWFEKYKWPVIWGALCVICVIIGISLIRSGKKGWGFAFLAAAGAFLVLFLKAMAKSKGDGNSKGFGGGRSGGGGGGGKW